MTIKAGLADSIEFSFAFPSQVYAFNTESLFVAFCLLHDVSLSPFRFYPISILGTFVPNKFMYGVNLMY